MEVEIINTSNAKINKPVLTQWVIRVFDELDHSSILKSHPPAKPFCLPGTRKKLTLAFVDKKTIQNLNQKFRKKNNPTDILSFSPVEEGSLGEIALCLSVIEQKTPEGFSSKKWLYYLILHGILHLLGFEHERGGDSAQKMYKLQDSIVEKLYLID